MILLSFLLLFARIQTQVESLLIQSFHFKIEQQNATQIERFSLIEAYVIGKTVESFDAYTFKNFEIIFEEGLVSVQFIDEKAYITYAFETELYAILHYDLVFDSSLDYYFVASNSPDWIDKNID